MKTKLLLLNASANTGSTGRICEEIGLLAKKSDYEVRFAFGRKALNSHLPLIKIGSRLDFLWHGVESRLLDHHGFASHSATRALIRELEDWKPDIVNIHNLHGYYINVELLFRYLKRVQKPVVWTFHDCWPFTGHCTYFDHHNCYKWESECHHCPNLKGYPRSWFLDNSRSNYFRKKEIFNGLNKLTIVTPSFWLAGHVSHSFLKHYPVHVIHNGVDLETFGPERKRVDLKKYGIENIPFILGVANKWDRRKGLNDFIALRDKLDSDVRIALVGLNLKQIKELPEGIIGIQRTDSISELASLFASAEVFVNPTYVDNFPTTNIEALSCGTPVVSYRTGGSPEAIDEETGIVVEKGDIVGLKTAIETILSRGKVSYSTKCRQRAEKLFDKNDRFKDYIDLFDQMLQNQ